MLIHLRTRSLALPVEIPLATMKSRVVATLDRFQQRLRLVEVRFEDINGSHHGGIDKRCQIELRLRDGSILVSDAIGETLLGSLDGALLRANRRLRHHLDRRLSLRRSEPPRLMLELQQERMGEVPG